MSDCFFSFGLNGVIEDGQTCKDGCFKRVWVKVCEFYFIFFCVDFRVCRVMKMNEMEV